MYKTYFAIFCQFWHLMNLNLFMSTILVF